MQRGGGSEVDGEEVEAGQDEAERYVNMRCWSTVAFCV